MVPLVIAVLIATLVKDSHWLIRTPGLLLYEIGPVVLALGTPLFSLVHVLPGLLSSQDIVRLLRLQVDRSRYRLYNRQEVSALTLKLVSFI